MPAPADGSSRTSIALSGTGVFRGIDGDRAQPSEPTWGCPPGRRAAEILAAGASQSALPAKHRRRRPCSSAHTPQEGLADDEFTGPYLQIGGAPVASEAVCRATLSRSSIHLANASTSVGDKPCASWRRASAQRCIAVINSSARGLESRNNVMYASFASSIWFN